jgi:hypothetical protein
MNDILTVSATTNILLESDKNIAMNDTKTFQLFYDKTTRVTFTIYEID